MDTILDTQNNITKQEKNSLISDEFVTGKKSSRLKDETSEILARHRSPKKIPVIAYKNRQTRQSESFCVDQRYKSNNYFQLPQDYNQIDGMSTSQNYQQMQMQANQLVMDPQFSPIPQQSYFLGTDEDVDATTAICQDGSSRANSLADRKSLTQFPNSNNKTLPKSEILHQMPQNNNMMNMNINPMMNQQLVSGYSVQIQQKTQNMAKGGRSVSHSETKQSKSKNNQPKSKRNKRKGAQSCSANQDKTTGSSGTGGQNSSKKQSNNSAQAKYKTVLCHHFEQFNRCPVGLQCQFAHGKAELRSVNDPLPFDYRTKNNQVILLKSNYKTERCKNMQTLGFCKFGMTCCFAHADHELRSLVDPEPILMQQPVNQFMSGCISDFDINSNQGGFLSQPISRRDSFNDMMSSTSSQVDGMSNDIMSLQAQDPNNLQDFDIEIREQDIAVHDFSQQQSPIIPTPKIVCNFSQPPSQLAQSQNNVPIQQQDQATTMPMPLVQPLQQVMPKKQKSGQNGTNSSSSGGGLNTSSNLQNQTSAQANATRIGAVYNNPMIDIINQATGNYQQDAYYNPMQQDPQQLQFNGQQQAMIPMLMPVVQQDMYSQQQQQMMTVEQQQQMYQYQQDNMQYCQQQQQQQQDMQQAAAVVLQNQQHYPTHNQINQVADSVDGSNMIPAGNAVENMDQYPDPLPAVHPNAYNAQQMQMLQQQQQQHHVQTNQVDNQY